MYSRKSNNQAALGDQGTAAYTNMPAGAGVGGTANYPSSQKVSGVGGTANYPSSQKVSGQKVGYGYEAGKDVNTANYPASQKAGYEYPQQRYGYGGDYVQTPDVTYGPDGTPIYATKKSHRTRNLIAAALAVACCCIIC